MLEKLDTGTIGFEVPKGVVNLTENLQCVCKNTNHLDADVIV